MIKRGLIFIIFLILVIPFVDAQFWDLFKEGNLITGRTSQSMPVSISIGNNAPNITFVSIDAETFAVSSGGIRKIEISFLANDTDGVGTLENDSAKVNISYFSTTGAGFLSFENTSCTHAYIAADDVVNYSCTVEMEYFFDHSTEWTVDAEINDTNGNLILNSSNLGTGGNWTYSEFIGTNFSATSLSWGSAAPGDFNQTSTTTQTVENIGNSLSLSFETTIIELAGAADGTTKIPAGNFTVFNSTTNFNECDYLNQSAVVTLGDLPIVGVNDTAVVFLANTTRRSQGSSESIYYCIFDVPADLTTQIYDATTGGNWDLTTSDSGEV